MKGTACAAFWLPSSLVSVKTHLNTYVGFFRTTPMRLYRFFATEDGTGHYPTAETLPDLRV